MSASCKFERSVLGHDEFETILVTHHPEIYDLNDTDLRDIQVRLRKMRDRERTLARQKRREARGKADPRGGSFPGTAEKPQATFSGRRFLAYRRVRRTRPAGVGQASGEETAGRLCSVVRRSMGIVALAVAVWLGQLAEDR